MNFCGLDVGTSGVKAVVFDESGTQLADAYHAYGTEYDPDGLRGLNPRSVWEQTKEVVREACAKAGKIDALAAASFGEAFVLLDEKDEPLHDISMTCTGSSSVTTRKVLLLLTIQKKLGFKFAYTESPDIETVPQLVDAVMRHMAEARDGAELARE